MLVAEFKVWIHGDPNDTDNIATIYITNVKEENNIANYQILIRHSNGFLECKEINNWEKGKTIKDGGGAMNLLKEALNAQSSEFNSALVHAINRAERDRIE